jgi:hypothetical protein
LTGPLNIERFSHTAALLPNGMVLAAGGVSSSGITASAELYDPVSGVWSAIGNMKAAREGHTATLLADGSVLEAAGNSGPRVLASAELYRRP